MKTYTVLTALALSSFFAQAAPKFELQDGDRVAFVGGVFMEREQEEGYIETMLTEHSLDKHVTFRNLGWSGDTAGSHLKGSGAVEARQPYVPSLFSYVEKIKPTVIFISYGVMESFDGPAGLDKFIQEYGTVLDKLSATTKRIVIISPVRHESGLGREEHNKNLEIYIGAIHKLAESRDLTFIDLFHGLHGSAKKPLTSNGVHLNDAGYQQAAKFIEAALELGPLDKLKKESQEEPLRAAIKHKNKQFWYFYRPMNSEYVYAGGTRFQDKLGPVQHPMDKELDEFYALAEKEDSLVAEVKAKVSQREKLPVLASGKPVSRPILRDPDAPDPEIERQSFKVADGFEVSLFAADPLINKPIQMAFDAKGRLWVATTTKYPQIKPGEDQDDKIIILEDTKGAGRADKASVFADHLIIPTGVLPAGDGCYTFDDTKLLFLHDRDGDGYAEDTEIVLSGFGTEDSHHKGHVLRFSPGGNLYFNQGVFLHSVIETAFGLRHHSGNWWPGIFEYQPNSGRFDVYLANSVPPNPWGHYWNRWGFDFHIDSSGTGGSYLILQTAAKTSSAIPIQGGEAKLAGAELISGRHFPDDWQGNLIASPFKENRVARWAFRDEGAGYALKQLAPLIVSTDNSFRPVDSHMGPDGALYIADWYNPLIGHMQYHFRDPGRDFTHGRIWRVTAKNRPLVSAPKFTHVSLATILDDLKAPEDYTRYQARRVLTERGAKEVLPALAKWVKKLNPNDPDFNHHQLEALWVYQSLDVVEPGLLNQLVRAKEPNARAAAAGVLRYWHDRISNSLDLLTGLVTDEHPRVRLEAVITLSHFSDARAMEIAAMAVDRPLDRFLEPALKNTIVALKPWWQPALESGKLTFDGNAARMQYVLQSVDSSSAVKPLLGSLKNGKLDAAGQTAALHSITASGNEKDLAALFDLALPTAVEAKALEALVHAVRARKISFNADPNRLKDLVAREYPPIQVSALQLAGALKAKELRAEVARVAEDPHSVAEVRKAALEALAKYGGAEILEILRRLSSNSSPDIRVPAIIAFAGKEPREAATLAAEDLKSDSASAGTIITAFLQRKGGGEILAAALKDTSPSSDAAKLGLRAMQTAGRQDAELHDVLSAAAGLSAEPQPLSEEELAKFVAEVRAQGNPARGESVFHRPEMSCLQCHAVNGAGGIVGPDLSAVGTGSEVNYLIESILFPNKIIKDGFESVEVTTKDDEYYLGIKVRDNKTELVLKDASHNEIVIPVANIKERKDKKVSLMPSGLANGLTHAELIDLVRFLSELGKPGPYANNPAPIARKWKIAGDTIAYSHVSGELPLSELPQGQISASCQIEVTTPGKIQLHLNATDGLTLKVDGQSQVIESVSTLTLPNGIHTLSFSVEAEHRAEGLRAEFEEIPGSSARFHVLNAR